MDEFERRRRRPGCAAARDLNDDYRFVSVGPWQNLEAIERWRSLPGWAERVAKLRELLVSFDPATLELVAERG